MPPMNRGPAPAPYTPPSRHTCRFPRRWRCWDSGGQKPSIDSVRCRNFVCALDLLRQAIDEDARSRDRRQSPLSAPLARSTRAASIPCRVGRHREVLRRMVSRRWCFRSFSRHRPSRLGSTASHLADSISLDPHKWLYQPLDCGCLLYRDRAAARKAFSFTGDYAKSLLEDPMESFAFFEETLELSRRFRALKLWLSLRYHGLSAFRRQIENDLETGIAPGQAYRGRCTRPRSAGARATQRRMLPFCPRTSALGRV